MHRTISILVLSLVAASLAAQIQTGVQTGSFPRGTKYAAPESHAPANVSRAYVLSVPANAASRGIDLPATGEGGMIVWTIPMTSNRFRSSLVTPTGRRLAAVQDVSDDHTLERFRFDASELGLDLPRSGQQEVIHIADAEAASYRLELSEAADVTLAVAEPESRLTLATWAAPLSRNPGEPVTLHAELRDGNEPLNGAHVTARLAAPGAKGGEPIELSDDGNGVYSAIVPDLDGASGMWSVRFDADGTNVRGARFTRTSSGGFMNERATVRLGSLRATIDGDTLRITAPAEVVIGGMYRFDVIIAEGEQSLAWGESTVSLQPGSREVSIEIPRALLGDAHDLFLDVRLLGLDPIGVAGRVTMTIR